MSAEERIAERNLNAVLEVISRRDLDALHAAGFTVVPSETIAQLRASYAVVLEKYYETDAALTTVRNAMHEILFGDPTLSDRRPEPLDDDPEEHPLR